MLGTIEDDLVASLKDQALLVGRITTAGRREFYFYTEDPPRCEHAIEHTMGSQAAYRFDLGSKRDDPWSLYLDLTLVNRLAELGEKLAIPVWRDMEERTFILPGNPQCL